MRITAKNLRGVACKTLDINKSTVLVGDNGSGKSTMLTVPYWVLTGKGLSIRNGALAAEGSIEFEGLKITRKMQGKKSTMEFNNNPCSSVALKKELESRNIHYDLLVSLFNPNISITSESLLKAIKAVYTPEQIIDLIDCPTEEHRAILTDYFKEEGIAEINVAEMKGAEKNFTDKRKAARKEIKSLSPFAEDVDMVDYDKLIKYNQEGTREMVEACNKVRKQLSDAQSNIAKRELTVSKIEQIKESIEQNKAKLNAFPAITISEKDVEVLQNKYSDLCANLTVLRNDADKEKAKKTEIENEIKHLKDDITKAEGTLSKLSLTRCPLCEEIECTLDKEPIIAIFKEKITALTKRLEEQTRLLEEQKQKINLVLANYEAVKKEMDVALKEVDVAKALLEEAKEQQRTIASTKDEIQRLEGELRSLQDESKKFEICGDVVVLENTIAQKEADIDEIKKQTMQLEVLRDKQKAQKQLQETIDKDKHLEEIYAFFVDKFASLPAETIEKKLSILNNSVNSVVRKIKPNFTISFRPFKAELLTDVTTKDGIIEYDELSEGERVCVDYVLRHLVCDLTGIKYIFIDNSNHLDEKTFKALTNMARESDKVTLLATSLEIAKEISIINF